MESKRGKAQQTKDICPMHHKNELGLHQSGLVLAFVVVFPLFVFCAPRFSFSSPQNPTQLNPQNTQQRSNKQPLFVHRGRFGGKNTSRIPTHDLWKTKLFFFFLDIPPFVYLNIFPSTPHRQTPFFQTKGSSRSPSPALYSFKPSCHSSILSLRLFDRKMESGNRKQQPTQQHHKTHKGYS